MPKRTGRQVFRVGLAVTAGILMVALPCVAQQLTNDNLSLTVNAQEGSYQLSLHDSQPVFRSRVAAQVDHQWLRSSDYPRHQASESTFEDDLGPGRAVTVICSGLDGKPDLVYVLQLYKQRPYGTVQVKVQNSVGKEVTVQAIRSVEGMGEPILNLGGGQSADRVLSDSFSEDWPDLALYDLGGVRGVMHRGAGSQLIYNRESKQSLFLGALTSDRFLTLMHLKAEGMGTKTKIASYTVESTGTTEIQKEFDLKDSPADDQVELSLPVKPGEDVVSERLMFEAGQDYHHQLLAYGDAVRRLHHARVSSETPIGWWSWTAYYGAINEGEVLANGDWQAEHLKSLGYRYFQIDEGYQYARGEYTTPNATQFPDGLRSVGHHLTGEGLTFGVWTAPFEVTSRAWIYEHHKDWLVHNAKGDPIPIGDVWHQKTDVLYALDTTHPGAQEYMRDTYRTLVREWGVRFIKLDFMDTTAIEGYHYRPNTTALEAQRIGLQVIRNTVGEEVILDKDGSPMLNPVGLVDTGRISADTGHSFERTKNAASGIAARFYMQRNFFVNDPDAFNVTARHLMERANERSSISLIESTKASQDMAPSTDPAVPFWHVARPVYADKGRYGQTLQRYRTEIRSRWTEKNLYFLFICPYEELNLKPSPSTSTETYQLWDWDVAEVFIGSDFQNLRRYREFEMSPLGEWVDLDIDLAKPHHEDGWTWNSGFVVAARIDSAAKIWYGAMRVPFSALQGRPPAVGEKFRINLFRSQGPTPNRAAVVWQPTMSDTFHIPEKFGLLRLIQATAK